MYPPELLEEIKTIMKDLLLFSGYGKGPTGVVNETSFFAFDHLSESEEEMVDMFRKKNKDLMKRLGDAELTTASYEMNGETKGFIYFDVNWAVKSGIFN